MVISACEWWAHETCLKCLAWLRGLKFSSCFQDGIKLWSKTVSFCLPPTLSGHFGPMGLMLVGLIMHLWIVVFPFSNYYQWFHKLKAFVLPNILISESRQTKSVQLTKNHFMMKCSLGLRALAYIQRWQTLTSWENGAPDRRTGSVTVWIFTQWVFLLHPLCEGNRLGDSIRDTL